MYIRKWGMSIIAVTEVFENKDAGQRWVTLAKIFDCSCHGSHSMLLSICLYKAMPEMCVDRYQLQLWMGSRPVNVLFVPGV